MGRKARALKQSALADLAGVSLSTLERIERGETVSAEALEKVTAALGMPADYFTTPRLPRTQKEMAEVSRREPANPVLIKVAPLSNQAQLRALTACETLLMVPSGDEVATVEAMRGLAEWIDFLCFVLNKHKIFEDLKPSRNRRAVYQSVLDHVAALQARGFVVLAGVTTRSRPGGDGDESVAFFSITTKAVDPSGLARRSIIIDLDQLSRHGVRPLLDR
ncbi:MAG: XRE family transcriptional regulator [Hyphomicrobiales bacterium]|nr:MAG: XRE family transcriptional regulator [Hyphomicrobiales bacterium]